MARIHHRNIRRHPRAMPCTFLFSALRSHIDDPVGRSDHVQIVFYDDHCVPCVHQAPKDDQQFLDVCKVQAGGWLVQDV